MNLAVLALRRAEHRLRSRLDQLDARLGAGDEAAWPSYIEAAMALAAVAPAAAPGAGGELLTTRELADRLQLSTKTIRRRAKAGRLDPVRFGQRGRGALRWPVEAAR